MRKAAYNRKMGSLIKKTKTMEKYTQEELKELIQLHQEWLSNPCKGKRLVLIEADLIYANLSYSNLKKAILTGSDLAGAYLRGVNLSFSDLRYSNLKDTDLRFSNLRCAKLENSNLSEAILESTELECAKTGNRYIHISGIGSKKRKTTYCVEDDVVWCGCFKGSLEEFEHRVQETHKDNSQYLKEYMGAIEYLKSLK